MFRLLMLAIIIAVGYFVYDSYGYRFVLNDVVKNSNPAMVMGSSDPDINIVTYVDYDDVASRRIYPVLLNLLSSDPNVSIIIKPIMSESKESNIATRVALAAKKQNQFMNINNVFLTANSDINERYIENAVRSLGLNYKLLRSEADSVDVGLEVEDLKLEAKLMNIPSYPYTYVGHVKLEGASHSLKDIKQILKDLRSGRR